MIILPATILCIISCPLSSAISSLSVPGTLLYSILALAIGIFILCENWATHKKWPSLWAFFVGVDVGMCVCMSFCAF
jgi:hypothetical protein